MSSVVRRHDVKHHPAQDIAGWRPEGCCVERLTHGDNGAVTGDDTNGVDNAEWWTTSDVAAYLGVQVSTVTNYRKRGQMPEPDMTVGRTHMWRPARIRSWQQGRPRPGVGGRRAGQSESAS